jgi:hypothetical protein
MDQSERLLDLETAVMSAIKGHMAGVWTAMPAVVTKYTKAAMTCELQVAVKERWRNKDGTYEWVDIPPLVDVPVIFPGGGGLTLTYPVKNGDEALVVFASRCIDNWWFTGAGGSPDNPTGQRQPEIRFHDLSDGFAFIGPRSKPRVLTNLSDTAAQLRTDDGAVFVEVGPGGIILHGDVTVTGTLAAESTTTDSLTVDGTVTASGEGTFAGHTVGAHVHSDPQGGTTGPPTG